MASQRVRRGRPHVAVPIRRRGGIIFAACLAFLWIGPLSEAAAADLRADTVAAFEHYVQLTEARMMEETAGRSPFLWLDRLAEPERREVTARLRRGEIVVD